MKKIYRSLIHVASVFLLLFMAFAALAQSRVVTGTITDDQGGPMPGVNVVIKGTTTGTTTNAAGIYSIEASENDMLVISFIGYTTQELRVGSQTRIDAQLSEDIATLEEIVVVGYGVQKKSDLTGAVSRVGAEELKGSIVTNIDQALQGRVAGVNISSNSGAPGAATTINIRGISTFGGSQPLYVIDGVQMSGQGGMTAAFTDGANGNTVVNPLSTINPNDIESIDVLKDASAAAIYGSQASNGVIIITTKRGKVGAPKISYNTYYALQTPRKKLDVMNMQEYASYRTDVARDFGNEPPQQFLDPSILGKGTDWQDEIFRTAPMLSHDLSISGGDERTKYAIMGGYFKQDGMAINSGLSRFTTRMNLDTKLKDWFTVGTNISYSNVTENIIMDASGDGVISQALTMAPDVPVRDINGNFAGPSQNANSAEMQSNPVGLAQMRVNDLKRQRFLINTYADLNIIKDLSLKTELSIDNNFSQNVNFSPSYQWGSLVEGESQLQDQRSNSFYWLWKTYATYNKNIGNHQFQLMVGHEMQKNKFEQTYVLKRNLASGDLLALSQGDQANQNTNGIISENSLMSYYGRLNYSFNEKYLVTLTLRGDGSSRFGPDNKWGYFPAAAIGWKVSNESFFPQSEVVSDVKIRAGYGEVGNQAIRNFAYTSTFVTVNSPFGTTYRLNSMENPGVKWEASTQYNIGLDVSLFEGRVDFVVDAYHKSSRGFLMQLPLPNIYGGGSGQGAIGPPFVNLGKMDNKGIDVAINTVNIDRGKFKWESSLTYSTYRNEIVELATETSAVTANSYFYGVFDIFTRSVIDRPIGQFYGFVTDGIFKSEEEILAAPVQVLQDGSIDEETAPQGKNYVHNRDGVWIGDIKYKDVNGDGVINTDDQTFIGDPNPKFSFGLNNTFKYGNFDLTVYITGVYGFDIFNASRIRTEGMLNQSNNQLATIANRAQIEMIDPTGSLDDISNVRLVNPGTDIPRFTSTNVNGNARIMQDRWIEDGSFVRIQNVSLGYTLPSSLISKINLNRVRVYFNAQNLHVFTNYSGLDPEVGASNQNILTAGIDTGRYPTPRVFTLGLNVDF